MEEVENVEFAPYSPLMTMVSRETWSALSYDQRRHWLANLISRLREFHTGGNGAVWISTPPEPAGRALMLWHIVSRPAFDAFLRAVRDSEVEQYFEVRLEDGSTYVDDEGFLELLLRAL